MDDNTGRLYEKIKTASFTLPNYLSYQAKDLISKIIVVDQEKRFKIHEINSHDWLHTLRSNVKS